MLHFVTRKKKYTVMLIFLICSHTSGDVMPFISCSINITLYYMQVVTLWGSFREVGVKVPPQMHKPQSQGKHTVISRSSGTWTVVSGKKTKTFAFSLWIMVINPYVFEMSIYFLNIQYCSKVWVLFFLRN